MQEKYKAVWDRAVKYLKKGVRKDFVLHTKNVVRAMELIVAEYDDIDKDKMIIAAIVHDVGWADVSKEIQINWVKGNNKEIGEDLHIKYAGEIIKKILQPLGYSERYIEEIIQIVQSHKSENPEGIEEKLLIDADNLSDIFREQITSDAKAYDNSLAEIINFRKNNTFHTEVAENIFQKELSKRQSEVENESNL